MRNQIRILRSRLSSPSGDWSGFYNTIYLKIAVDLKKPFRLNGIYRTDVFF